MQCRACRTTSEQLGVSGVVAGPPFPCYDTPQAGYTEVESRVAASRVIRNDNIGSVCPRAASGLLLLESGQQPVLGLLISLQTHGGSASPLRS